jgi:hypothetical protein
MAQAQRVELPTSSVQIEGAKVLNVYRPSGSSQEIKARILRKGRSIGQEETIIVSSPVPEEVGQKTGGFVGKRETTGKLLSVQGRSAVRKGKSRVGLTLGGVSREKPEVLAARKGKGKKKGIKGLTVVRQPRKEPEPFNTSSLLRTDRELMPGKEPRTTRPLRVSKIRTQPFSNVPDSVKKLGKQKEMQERQALKFGTSSQRPFKTTPRKTVQGKIIDTPVRTVSKKPEGLSFKASTVSAVERPKFKEDPLGSISTRLSEESQKATTQRLRGKPTTVVPFLVGAAQAPVGAAVFGKQLVTSPVETTRSAATGIKEFGLSPIKKTREAFKSGSQQPAVFAGRVVGEVFTAKGLGRVGSFAKTKTTSLTTRFRPGFRPVQTTPTGEQFIGGLPTKVEGRSEFRINLAGGTASTAESLKLQARLAGQEVDAVSAQRSLLGTFRRRKITVDKPKPLPTSPELERAFFADPRGRVRQSRLGLEAKKEAGIVDILSGDVTFKAEKPQILFFEKTKVQAFPKGLRGIETKLKRGKTLTLGEAKALEEFQLKPSGQFKPIGFATRESEVLLAPGEVIKRRPGRRFTVLQGRKVEIIPAEIGGARSPELKQLIKKSTDTKLSSSETRKLKTLFKGETGFSLPTRARPRLSPAAPLSLGVSVRPKGRRITRGRTRPRGFSPRTTPRGFRVDRGTSVTRGRPTPRGSSLGRTFRVGRTSRGLSPTRITRGSPVPSRTKFPIFRTSLLKTPTTVPREEFESDEFFTSSKSLKFKSSFGFTPSFSEVTQFRQKSVLGKAPKAKKFSGLEVRQVFKLPKRKGKFIL